jgi:hypothetical protein
VPLSTSLLKATSNGDTMNRARNIPEVEYELLKHLLSSVNITPLEAAMATDDHSRKRFATGVKNIIGLLDNMAERRVHRLPKEHADYKPKE